MDNIISIRNLRKSYGDVQAVKDISFDVERGSLFAFLGLNGAGKSTTINILCSILKKDGGKIYIDNADMDKHPEKIKKAVGIVFQNSVLDSALSVKDNLKVRASYYGLRGEQWEQRLAELSNALQLDEILKRPYGKLSGGQKRRADIARGLINRPKILFLDEPTTGLDPQTRQGVWKTVLEIMKKEKMTVFLTTHYMEEANKADRVVIIDSGRIVANDTPNNLKNVYSGDYLRLYLPRTSLMDEFLEKNGYRYEYAGESYSVKVNGSEGAKDFILKYPRLVYDFEVIKGDMDDVFLNATGKKLEGN